MYCVYLGKAIGTVSPPDGSVNSAKIVDGSITNDDLAGSITESKLAGSISSAKITSLDAAKLTGTVADARFPATLPASSGANLTALPAANLTGSIADARVPASAVTQHVTATDLTPIRQDLAMLALYNAVSDNRAAYNLPSSFIDQFEDDTGLTTQTDVSRNIAGEYISSIVPANGIDSYTKLMLHMDDAGLTDSSSTGHTTTIAGNAARSTAVTAKFGTHSMYCDGAGSPLSSLRVADHADWDFGTGDFTIDCWIYPTSVSGSYRAFIGSGNWGGPNYDFLFDVTPTATIRWHIYNGSAGPATSDATTVSAGTWTHMAVCRSGSTTTVYINGVAHGTLSGSENIVSNGQLYIGSSGNIGGSATSWLGYLDEVRISKGIARYSGNFDTETAAYNAASTSATGTLISDTQTASSATTKMSGVILYKDNGSGASTLGTHLKIYLSANGGTNWTEVVAADYGAVTPLFSTGVKMVRLAEQTVTSGTTPVMKAVWASQASGTLETQLHGWAMNY